MKSILNGIIKKTILRQMPSVEKFITHPQLVQRRVLSEILEKGKSTEFAGRYGLDRASDYDRFARQVPLHTYEDLQKDIERMKNGQENVLWPGKMRFFSKSSGTTSSKSKYIPMSAESIRDCNIKAARDFMAIYLDNNPSSRLFTGKSLRLGGSIQERLPGGICIGDLSAVLMNNTPTWADLYSAPRRKVATMSDWNEKLPAMASALIPENITSMAGVPSWMLVLIRYILERTGKKFLTDLWPDLELFMHGGVNFEPYRKQYQNLIPSPGMHYYNIYNASEGFFAAQDRNDHTDMLLLLDHGVFFEFIPMEDFYREDRRAVPLWGVDTETNYAMVITTNAGLWRYVIGDTVRFTSLSPYRISITGRTRQFINAFGEEVIVENAEKALQEACRQTGAIVREYTAGPVYMEGESSGAHQWIIEFSTPPRDTDLFTDALDRALMDLNSDYQAKRTGNITLSRPLVNVAPENLFYRWMEKRGKSGGQNKVPRLSNDRKYLDSLLGLMEKC